MALAILARIPWSSILRLIGIASFGAVATATTVSLVQSILQSQPQLQKSVETVATFLPVVLSMVTIVEVFRILETIRESLGERIGSE